MFDIKKIAVYVVKILATGIFIVNSVGAAIPIEQWSQASGAQVFLVRNAAIPMVDVQIDFDAGSRRDPAAQAGLASVTAEMMSKGLRSGAPGETALDENALGEAWADLGARFDASASADRLSFSLRSLTYPDLLSRAVRLASRQLAEPALPRDVWLRERQGLIASIKEANTRPATLASRAFSQAVYGDHPYGFEMTEATLLRIDVGDMQALLRRLIAPCRAKVTVVGAVDRAQADALVQQLLARLSAPAHGALCDALPALPDVAPLVRAAEVHVDFNSAQAHLLMGQPGYKRDDPDHFALTVGNYILGGGGFVARLTHEVREKRGLSYSVYSAFGPGLHSGAFTIGLETRPDQAEQALTVARAVLEEFVAKGPTADELQAAKANLIGGFALLIDSNRKLLANVANIAWNDLPLNYLDTWTQRVDQVTVADIQAAFARKLHPEKMVTVVLGGVGK